MAVISLHGIESPALADRCRGCMPFARSARSRCQQYGQRTHSAVVVSQYTAFTSACPLLVTARRRTVHIHASTAGTAQPASPDEAPKSESPVAKFKALLSPFSEPSTNKKLLALCGAQALSSVATLIHDTYLPLYLSEELKLSNTKASQHRLTINFTSSPNCSQQTE